MKGDYTITIEKSHYDPSVHGGKLHYSVSCMKNFGDCYGVGSPCDTEEEVIRTITNYLKEEATDEYNENHRPPTKRNTVFENTVKELKHITLEYLLAKAKDQRDLRFMMAGK